jgi:hypothetical protein
MEGKWIGAMPLDDADNCKMELQSGNRFSFACGGDHAWVGQGRYRVRGNRLTYEFDWLADRGRLVKNVPEPIVMQIDGKMNRLIVVLPDGRSVVWERKL